MGNSLLQLSNPEPVVVSLSCLCVFLCRNPLAYICFKNRSQGRNMDDLRFPALQCQVMVL